MGEIRIVGSGKTWVVLSGMQETVKTVDLKK